MENTMFLKFASSLTKICEVNQSFDRGVLKICYTNENRNKTFISKEAIVRSLKTIYNVPIVCNYKRESESLGGHDIEVIKKNDGTVTFVNITEPVGVIPESANVWFDVCEEEDGSENEYLFADALIWKRQEAYETLVRDGITAQSMEISVKDGEMIDGIYHINDFVFTAFTLLGDVEPCFEGASLEMFSMSDFKEQFSKMVQDLKEVNMVDASKEVYDTHPQKEITEGGEEVLKEDEKVIVEEPVEEPVEEEAVVEEPAAEAESETVEASEDEVVEVEEAVEEPAKFALTEEIVGELIRQLDLVKTTTEWGETNLYCYLDSDFDTKEVYCWDFQDGLTYGFKYEVNGDAVIIDFESKKRKKRIFADFEEGDVSPATPVFALFNKMLKENTEWEAKYQSASDKISSMESELADLRSFKKDTEAEKLAIEKNNIFAKFADLEGLEAFEELKNSNEAYSLDEIEEKCFALRGRNAKVEKFSVEQKAPKIMINNENIDTNEEPYGGAFVKYGKK